MKLTALKELLKRFGIAACRFQQMSAEERAMLGDPEAYDVYQSGLTYQPWRTDALFQRLYMAAQAHTLVPIVHCWTLYSVARQAIRQPGEIWECGVYRGGTALLLKGLRDVENPELALRFFDTFEGMPETDPKKDIHRKGDFQNTSLSAVRTLVGIERTHYHQGLIPETFRGLESSAVCFAHIDLDIYEAILESCRFIYPRLVRGGALVFDDYGYPSCPGARAAVDEFFTGRAETPLVLPTGQALIYKV